MHKLFLGIDRSTYQIEFKKICEIAENFGFDGIELQPEHPDIFKIYPFKAVSFVNDILSNYKFEISFHTPIKDLNISSYNKNIRKFSINQIKESIEFAKKIKAKYIVTHGGKNSFKTTSSFSKKCEKIALNSTIDALTSFYDICSDNGLTLSVENMSYSDWRMTSKIKYLERIFQEIPDLKLTLDIDHAILRSKNYVDKFIEVFNRKLISSHIGLIKNYKFYLKKLLKLSNLKFFVLEPHSYFISPNIIKIIKDNINELKKLIK
ncbi:MAG: sugar phosphate isomerase/epimerase [Candidatus Helarchaeota archaeon]|nr:sugar phosphate isomerase/epimerase [Candidatus Helarchaeota archaeon]